MSIILIVLLVNVSTFVVAQHQAKAAGVNPGYVTFSDAYLSDTSAWGIRWADASSTLSITDVLGPGVQFALANVVNKMGIGDVYPVGIPGIGDDLTSFSGFELYLENTGSAGFNGHLYMNTGYTGGGAQPQNDTFWGGPWIWLEPGQTNLFTLNFAYAEAWNAEDDPEIAWRVPGGTWTNVKRLNQVTNIGFEVLGTGNFSLLALGSSNPKLYVDPPNVVKSASDNNTLFSVDIAIENFTDLYAFDISMTWDSSLLKFESAAYTSHLDNLWGSSWNPILETSTTGSYKLVATKLGFGGNSSTDAFVLFSLTLRIIKVDIAPLQTPIHFGLIKLSDSATPTPNQIIPASVTDGMYYMSSGPGPDVAIASVDAAKGIVCQDFGVNVSVSVSNQGLSTETFNVTLHANSSLIERRTITLGGGSSVVTTFIWNTTGYSKGLYAMWAYAEPLFEEADQLDNNCTGGNIRVTAHGDIAPEFGVVDIFDLVTCALAFGSEPGWSNWNPVADINNDAIIDIFDLVVVSINFG